MRTRRNRLRTLLFFIIAIGSVSIDVATPGARVFAFDALQSSDQNPTIATSRVKEVMRRFAGAVKDKDMASFHGSVVMSRTLATQVPTEKMAAAFKPLLDSGADLTLLDAMQPVFDAPLMVDSSNELVVKGHYPSAPPTLFEMHFIREGERLGLSFIDVHLANTTPARPPPSHEAPRALERKQGMPDDATLVALTSTAPPAPGALLSARESAAVHAAMHAFAIAAKARDMNLFLNADIVSRAWREHQTAAQLNAAYANTLALSGDFTALDELTPIVPNPPSATARGALDISGYYVAADTRIGFRMGFIDEGGALRLINFVIVPKHPQAAK